MLPLPVACELDERGAWIALATLMIRRDVSAIGIIESVVSGMLGAMLMSPLGATALSVRSPEDIKSSISSGSGTVSFRRQPSGDMLAEPFIAMDEVGERLPGDFCTERTSIDQDTERSRN